MEAIPLIDQVLNDPDHPERRNANFWRALAIWSADAHHHESVRDAYREIVKTGANAAPVFDEFAMAQVACGDYEDASASVALGRQLCELQKVPWNSTTRLSLLVSAGGLAFRNGQPSKGRALYAKALELDGYLPREASYMLAQLMLCVDHRKRGWMLHEHRLSMVSVYKWEDWHAPKVPRWWPGLKGRVVFWQEQGAGDLLMMLRYAPMIAESSGEEIVVRCGAPLWSVVRDFPGVGAVVGRTDAVDADFELPILSAPFAFGVDGWSDVPPPVVHPEFAWRPYTGDHVGVCWSGAKGHPNDRDRSAPPETLEALRSSLPDDILYQSLQPGPCPEWMFPLPVGDYGQTAHLMRGLDAVVSVDTSVVHLAGLVGVPTVMIPPAAPEWRWGTGPSSPWYPDLTIVKRRHVGAWTDAWRRSAAAVAKVLALESIAA